MSRREDIDTGIYSDPDFLALGPISRAVYIWSWTNSHCGMAGLFKIDRRLIELETGWSGGDLDGALAELEAAQMVFYDGRVMWCKARLKRLRTKSPNIAKSVARDLESVGWDHPFVRSFVARYGSQEWLTGHLGDGCATVTQPSIDPSETPCKPLEGFSNPSGTVQGKGKGKGVGGVGEGATAPPRRPEPPPPDEVPADLPPPLADVAVQVARILERVAVAKGAKPVTVAATGRAVGAFPDRDYLAVAGEFEHWWVHGGGASKPLRDVVAAYRNRLGTVPPTPGGTVHVLPGGRAVSELDRVASAYNREPA